MRWAGLTVLLVAAATLAACNAAPAKVTKPPLDEVQNVSLCTLVSYEDAAKALGSPPVGATDTSDHGALNPGCSWMADTRTIGQTPRMLVFTVWRKSALTMQGSAMSGKALYDDEVKDLSEEFNAAAPFYGAGDEGAIAAGKVPDGDFHGKIIVRKGDDVLTMSLTGADQPTFEAIARKIAKAM